MSFGIDAPTVPHVVVGVIVTRRAWTNGGVAPALRTRPWLQGER